MMRAPTPGDRLTPAGPEGSRPPPRKRRVAHALYRRVLGGVLAVGILAVAVASLVAWRAYVHFSTGLPTVAGLQDYHPAVMSRVYDGDDHLIAELATERRIFVPYAAIPTRVQNAFVAAEDQNFWTHNGVDPLAVLRAAVTDLENMHSGRRPIGASTITEQVAKNMILQGNITTMQMKVKEAILALRIEQTLSKQRILEIYLNEIYLGEGAYGIAAAAQTYFDKPLDELSIAQAAFLGALPKGPSNYDPHRNPVAAKGRRDWVIDRMVDTHAITAEQAQAAKAEPLIPAAVVHRPPPTPGADWFTEEVRRELVEKYGADQVNSAGFTVQTSLDPRLQSVAADALRRGLLAYDRSHGEWHGPVTHLDGFAAAAPVRHGRHAVEQAPVPAPDWKAALGRVAHPPGMLPNWTLGIVLSEGEATAQIGWLSDEGTGDVGTPHLSTMSYGDSAWARTSRGRPVRMADIAKPGDVVMVEPATGDPAKVELRQIPRVEGAIVSLDPSSGRVLAMVGGWSAELSQFNRATQAQRQPGSSFKPIVYLAAMEKGISPSQQFLDAPFAMGNWRPENYELDFNGPTALHDALRKSLNLVTIRLAAHIGMQSVADTAIALHEVDAMPKVLPAALGAVGTTVLREAGAYATLDENGREVIPSLIDSVQDRDGNVVWKQPGFTLGPDADPNKPPSLVDDRKQVADAASAFQVVTMMRAVVEPGGTGVPAVAGLDGRPVAGKTGTSQDFNDAWFVGFTPGLVTAVWVGFDQPQSLGDKETGGAVAGPIWNAYMRAALDGTPVHDFRPPDGVTLVRYNTNEGSAVDAFKPDQIPGQSNAAASNENSNVLGPEDTGADLDADMPPSEGGAVPLAPAPGAAPEPGTAPAPNVAGGAAAKPAGGGDIGVGGLY